MNRSSTTLVLHVEAAKANDALPYWGVRWHEGDQYLKRRLGQAWVTPTGSRDAKPGGKTYGQHGQWTQRRGRVPEGVQEESTAAVLAAKEQSESADRVAAEEAERVRVATTFRGLVREWQTHMLKTNGHSPSAARDVQSTFAEPGEAYKRGDGETAGFVMRTLGERPAHAITVTEINELLDEFEGLGNSDRTINKKREQLRAIFNYGGQPKRGWGLTANPAAESDKRRVADTGGVSFFEIDQVEAIATAAAAGLWRGDALATYDRNKLAVEQEQEENEQLAELVRVAAYTGLRQGEFVVSKCSDINFEDQTLLVERALSAGTITAPKSGKLRVVALGGPALAALKRIMTRKNFTGPDDYVFATLAGDRPNASALRRRYDHARDAAGAPTLTFHGLRHTAVSLFIRRMDPAEVKAIMGHASIKTTERYLHARRASDLVDKATAALTVVPLNREELSEEDRLAEQLLSLNPETRKRLLKQITALVV